MCVLWVGDGCSTPTTTSCRGHDALMSEICQLAPASVGPAVLWHAAGCMNMQGQEARMTERSRMLFWLMKLAWFSTSTATPHACPAAASAANAASDGAHRSMCMPCSTAAQLA